MGCIAKNGDNLREKVDDMSFDQEDVKMKVIELKYLNELHDEFHSLRFEDETFSQFVERTTDDGVPIWREI